MNKIDLFKMIISSEKHLLEFTKKGFIYKTLNDKFFNMIEKNKKLKVFTSKQEIFEFFVTIFLYKYHPKIRKKIDYHLEKNELLFSKNTDPNLPDVKIEKYWYEISSFNSNIYKYKNNKEFLDEMCKKINEKSKFKHLKKNQNSIDLIEISKYFINEVYKIIIRKLSKTYIENKKNFKIKKLIIFQAYPIPIVSSEFFLETLIKKYGKEINNKMGKDTEIFICFPEPKDQEKIKIFVAEYDDKIPKNSTLIRPEKNIIIEINQNTKKIYENNNIIYQTNFSKLKIDFKNLVLK